MKISGNSMFPRLKHGDFVLIRNKPVNISQLHVGDIIVFEHEIYGTLIKRIEQIDTLDNRIFVRSENEEGLDSRELGWIHFEWVNGKVIHHIHPEH